MTELGNLSLKDLSTKLAKLESLLAAASETGQQRTWLESHMQATKAEWNRRFDEADRRFDEAEGTT